MCVDIKLELYDCTQCGMRQSTPTNDKKVRFINGVICRCNKASYKAENVLPKLCDTCKAKAKGSGHGNGNGQ